MSEKKEKRWVCTYEDAPINEAETTEPRKKESPDEERADLRRQWRRGRETFYSPPAEPFEATVERLTKEGPESAAYQLRDLVTQTMTCKNAIAHLEGRLRYAVNERNLLEEHLRLALEEAKMHKGQRGIVEAALHRTCNERDALKKQLRDLAPTKKAKASKGG
jgi:hypothetical protein